MREAHARLAPKGVHFLDAPVSGGPGGAASGKLAIWVGGDRALFDKHKTVLDAMADQARYIGEIGAGSIAKLVHNVAATAMNAVLAEAMTMGVKAGLDAAPLYEAIRTGAGGRMRAFDNIGRRFLQGKLDPPNFALRLVHKDVALALQVGPRGQRADADLQPGSVADHRSAEPRLGRARQPVVPRAPAGTGRRAALRHSRGRDGRADRAQLNMPIIRGGKFVVLGGASQVGSTIAEQLLAEGARDVVLLDNLMLGDAGTMESMLADARCRFVRGDVLRLNELYDVCEAADGVFAVAAYMASSIGQNPWAAMDVNIRGLQNALEACRMRGVKKVVISSSASVYGAPEDDPTHEASPLRWDALPPAMALYCASKVVGEGLARLYRDQYGLDFVALRYTAVYGERQHRRALVGGHIAESCERIRNGQPPVIEGDGSHVHDYVHVVDVARANLLAMESAVSGEGINICGGEAVSQRRIVEIALAAAGSALEPESARPQRSQAAGRCARQHYSGEKARRLLGLGAADRHRGGNCPRAALGQFTTTIGGNSIVRNQSRVPVDVPRRRRKECV